MANTINFYKDLLKTFGIEEDKDRLVFISSTGKKLPINLEGLPIILPRKELIADIVEIVDGKPRLKARIFNPLAESVIKGENKSLTKLRKHIERMVEHSFLSVSMMLLEGTKYQDEIESCDPKFLEFIEMIQYKQPGVKKVVDDETIKKWETIADIGTEKDKTFIHMFVKKGGKIGDVKYTRVGTITFPLYEELENMNVKEDLLLGKVKIRNKDKHVFQKLYEFIFELTKEELLDGFMIGTKNTTSPSFIITMMMYDFLKNKINKAIDIAKSLNLDNEILNTLILPDLPLDIKELEKFIDKIKYEILEIPSDHDLLVIDYSRIEEPQPQSVFNQQPNQNQQTQQNTSRTQQDDSDELSPEEAMRLFGGGGAPYGGFPSTMNNQQPHPQPNSYQPQQPMQPTTGNPLLDGLMKAEQKAYMEKMYSAPKPNTYGFGNNQGLNSGANLPPRNTYQPQPNTYGQPPQYNPYNNQPPHDPYRQYNNVNQQLNPYNPYGQPNPYDPYRRY